LTAVDAATGEKRWEVPLGVVPWLKNPDAEKYGSPSLGGPVATAGGVVFMGGSFDAHIRAFDVETGKELWRGDLPGSARATAMTFRGPGGKQYVVISAGGHSLDSQAPGDSVVAFALP
jgi:quinoprotein glucose dehydrogenase